MCAVIRRVGPCGRSETLRLAAFAQARLPLFCNPHGRSRPTRQPQRKKGGREVFPAVLILYALASHTNSIPCAVERGACGGDGVRRGRAWNVSIRAGDVVRGLQGADLPSHSDLARGWASADRSEERRVGKEC